MRPREKSSAYFPTEMYDSYIAGVSEAVSGGPDRSQTTVQSSARAGRSTTARWVPTASTE